MSDKLAVLQTEESIKELDSLNAKINETIKVFKELSSIVDETNSLLTKGTPKEYVEALNKLKKAEKELEESRKKTADAGVKIIALERKLAQAESEEGVELEKLKLQIQAVNKANKEQAKEMLDMVTSYQKFAKQVTDAKNHAKELHAEMLLLEQRFKNGEISVKEYNARLNELSIKYTEAKLKATGLDSQLKSIDKAVGDNQRNVGNYSSAINGLSGSLRGLMGAFGVSLGLQAFAEVMKSSYGTIKELNAQNYALKEVFETEAQVSYQKEYLSEISRKYGLELVSTTEAYTKFSAAIKGSVIEGEEGRKVFTAFSAASSKLGLSADEQKGIFKALEQMMSKGKIQAEELRGQLGDRMSGAFKLFASAMGVSTKELDEMLKKGEVFSADVLPKVREELEKQHNLAEDTDTLAAAQNRLSNAWTEFLDKITTNKDVINGLSASLEGLQEILQLVLSYLVSDELGESASLFEQLGDIIDLVLEVFRGFGMEVKDLDSFIKQVFNQGLTNLKYSLEGVKLVLGGLIDLFKDLANILNGDFSFSNFENRLKSFTNNVTKINNDFQRNQRKINASPEELKEIEKEEQGKRYRNALVKATKDKQAYFQHNGKYYSTKTGKNTLKSVDDYIDKNGKLVLKEKTKDDFTKDPKPPRKPRERASRIPAKTKDAIDNLTAERDTELGNLKARKINGTLDEVAYQDARISVIQSHAKKIQDLLNKNNAKENKLSAETYKKAVDELEKYQKEIYDHKKKALDAQYQQSINALEREKNTIEQNQLISETERIALLMDTNQKITEQTDKHYQELIQLAKEYRQNEFQLMAEHDTKMLKHEDEQLKLLKNLEKARITDIEKEKEREMSYVNMTYEQQKTAILQDKSLKLADKELQIKLLEFQQQKKINEEKIKALKLTVEELKLKQKENGGLSKEEDTLLFNSKAEISKLEGENTEIDKKSIDEQGKHLIDKFSGIRDVISNGFKNLGLDTVSEQFGGMFDNILKLSNNFFSSLEGRQKAWAEIASAGVQIVASFGTKMIEEQKQRRIAQIDEEITRSQEQTDLEVSFIEKRLEAYSNMSDLTQQQIEDRNALEDEARVLKEQQAEREKLLQAQKVRAEQKAQAQQALIDGASGAVKSLAHYGFTPAGWAAAASSVAFAALQYSLIMSRNPIPQYFVGRKGGKKELAWTQEKGAEMITDRHGNIKTLGTDKGATLTHLEQGDIVYTASETKKLLNNIPADNEIFKTIALKNITPIVAKPDPIDYHKLAQMIGEQQERVAKKYDKPSIYEEGGIIFKQEGAKIPVAIGRAKKNTIIIKSNKNERD